MREKDVSGLQQEVTALLRAHFNLRMQKATQQLTNHSALSKTRRDVARVKTILREKQAAADGSAK
jgi:large subunit ribosomal protein L29